MEEWKGMCSAPRTPRSQLLNNHQQKKTLETTGKDPPSHRLELATERSRRVTVGIKSVLHLPGGGWPTNWRQDRTEALPRGRRSWTLYQARQPEGPWRVWYKVSISGSMTSCWPFVWTLTHFYISKWFHRQARQWPASLVNARPDIRNSDHSTATRRQCIFLAITQKLIIL